MAKSLLWALSSLSVVAEQRRQDGAGVKGGYESAPGRPFPQPPRRRLLATEANMKTADAEMLRQRNYLHIFVKGVMDRKLIIALMISAVALVAVFASGEPGPTSDKMMVQPVNTLEQCRTEGARYARNPHTITYSCEIVAEPTAHWDLYLYVLPDNTCRSPSGYCGDF
ncbi:hypothetical protein [Nonomuraea sp. SYSU D8015]|uniref:hypothetical protein n=1 Tax=Nonomuraea sp. SYSU D8015 TaxID=2593644 RepID=UPI0016604500|nr:hypothetical protein [Nonomuraea sp. SYSU D8015]